MSNNHAVTINLNGPVEPGRQVLSLISRYTLLQWHETPALGDFDRTTDGLLQWGLQCRWSDPTWGRIPEELFTALKQKQHELYYAGISCKRITKSVNNDYGIARTLLNKSDAALLAELGAEFAVELSVADEKDFLHEPHPLLPTAPGYRTVVGIDFYGFDISPDIITRRLGIEPETEWRAEDVDSCGKPREKNRWYSCVESEEMAVNQLVLEYLDHIRPLFSEIEAMGLRNFAELRVGALGLSDISRKRQLGRSFYSNYSSNSGAGKFRPICIFILLCSDN